MKMKLTGQVESMNRDGLVVVKFSAYSDSDKGIADIALSLPPNVAREIRWGQTMTVTIEGEDK